MTTKINLKEIYKGNLPWLVDRTILGCIHGSKAYGIDTPESDTDIKGICIAPSEYYHGFLNNFEQAEFKHDPSNGVDSSQHIEGVIYDIIKFAQLAVNCNPNILELLFVDESDYFILTDAGKILVENRDKFLSKKARYTFSGYAHAQLKRIKNHRSWLLNPPKKAPSREDFGLSITTKISQSQIGAMAKLIESEKAEFTEDVIHLYQREQEYLTAKKHWDQYQNWKKNRNPKRAALEEKFQYDCKHAGHLFRLLKMGHEILTEGRLTVKRPDREEILAIRNGQWTYDQLIEWAEKMESELEQAYQESKLPHAADIKAIDKIIVKMVEASFSDRANNFQTGH